MVERFIYRILQRAFPKLRTPFLYEACSSFFLGEKMGAIKFIEMKCSSHGLAIFMGFLNTLQFIYAVTLINFTSYKAFKLAIIFLNFLWWLFMLFHDAILPHFNCQDSFMLFLYRKHNICQMSLVICFIPGNLSLL